LIEDLGSTNGTFVNRGRRLAPGDRQPLKDGDEIIVGKRSCDFGSRNRQDFLVATQPDLID
jgi:pSer/pThr/pTyr-binding forkhead associated (FHA) protein